MTRRSLSSRDGWRPRASGEVRGATAATAILDWASPEVRGLLAEISGTPDRRVLLQQAHRLVSARVSPRYAIEEIQPASVTLRRGRGSCSQRLAVLEAVARGAGMRTRVRGLLVAGEFWYARFPRDH
ncbi:MAG: hypothetical protein QM655_08990 [Nocardioidaceae bacterium]